MTARSPLPPKNRPRGKRPSRGPAWPWDDTPANEKLIAANLATARKAATALGRVGRLPTADDVRDWHIAALSGVRVADSSVVGRFRGEDPGPTTAVAYVGLMAGLAPAGVPKAIHRFFRQLASRVDQLDPRRDEDGGLSDDLYDDVLDLLAWVHGQWVRIHPFVNLNGSTARLLTVSVAAYFGLPLPLPGKPRPTKTFGSGLGLSIEYGHAAGLQMAGTDEPMRLYLAQLLA
ncbi:Fic family protein [Jatrophihabitans cynanchi]|uniref:Fic family protein n=1 Tax=Jatrophihabitans cynanchi TaxID=2944128 RepID=A0ABY7JV22_9ACTN|nr:Fic family protein [Jatrophihabitans sp. SB3-54]WAX55543.1 Fic family protein [Jatrophihabitans sp. SB3-54]